MMHYLVNVKLGRLLVFVTFLNCQSVRAVIKQSIDLYCDFETSCVGWKNGTELDEKLGFNVARTVVTDPWHSVPWPFQGVYFAYVLGNGAETPQTAWLVTDTIPCLPSSGYLTLYYWKNSFLSGLFSGGLPLFKIGIRQPPWSPNIRVLSTVTGNNQWGWRFAVVEIPPSNESFQIVIEGVVQGKLDVVGVDDIVFHGYINERDCNKAVESTTSSAAAKQPLKPSDVDKNFYPFESESKKPREKDLQSLFETIQQNVQRVPGANKGEGGLDLSQSGRTSFSTNAGPSFVQVPVEESKPQLPFIQEIMTKEKSMKTDGDEQTGLSANPVVESGSVSQQRFSKEPSNLSNRERPLDLKPRVKSTLVPSSTESSRIKPKVETGQTFRQVISGNCTSVNCGFEGDSCAYEGTDSPSGAWIIAEGRIGNPLTGVTGPAFGVHYAAAYTTNGTSTLVLRSAPFITKEKSFLTFWYYFASASSGRLVLCDNSLDSCMWEQTTTSINAESRRWKHTTIQLKPGRHQLYFVVEELRANYFAALDQILLRKSPSGQFAECFPAT